MRLPVAQAEGTFDFGSVGRVLELLDGEVGRLAIGFKRGRDAQTLLGGAAGPIHLFTAREVEKELADIDYVLPDGAVEPDERAHMLSVGDAHIAIGSVEFRGASYHEGALRVQLGPVLLTLTTEPADA